MSVNVFVVREHYVNVGYVRVWPGGWSGGGPLRRALLAFALGVGRLEHSRGRHQVLDVLTQNLVLRLQLEVLLFDGIHSSRQVWNTDTRPTED